MRKEKTEEIFESLKISPYGSNAINSGSKIDPNVTLIPFASSCLEDDGIISLLSSWRDANQHGFLNEFNVTDKGTRTWARTRIIDQKDNILFLVDKITINTNN